MLDLAVELKDERSTKLAGQTLGLVFIQPSTRTRISFSAAMTQLGGRRSSLRGDELQLSRGESIADTARVLSRYVDAVAIRTLSHDDLEQWAEGASIPVINALTEVEHPVPGARRRAHDPRPARRPRRRPHRLGRRRHERARLARRDREADRVRASSRPARRATTRPPRRRSSSCATRARRPPAPTCSSPTSGSASARRPTASAACATSSPTASTRRCSPRPRTTRSCCTACRRTPARRSPPTCSTARSSAVWDEAENRLHVQKALLALLLGAA